VACVVEGCFEAAVELYGLFVLDGLKKRETGFGVFGGVQWEDGIRACSALLFVSFELVFGVFFQQFCGVEEDDFCDFSGCGGAVDFSFEAFADEFWQEAAMVEVSVGQEDGVYRCRGNGKRLPVSFAQVSFLIEAAVNQQACTVCFEQVA